MVPTGPGTAGASKSDAGQVKSADGSAGWALVSSAPIAAVLAALELDDALVSRAASQSSEWNNPWTTGAAEAGRSRRAKLVRADGQQERQ